MKTKNNNHNRRKKENKSSLASSLETRSKAGEENISKDTMPVNADTHADTLMLSERLNGLKNAKKFCKLNKITPSSVIVLWEE